MATSPTIIPAKVLTKLRNSKSVLKYIKNGISRKEKTARTRAIIRAIAESVSDQDISFEDFLKLVSPYEGLSGASITDTRRSFKNTRKRLEDDRSSKRRKLNPDDNVKINETETTNIENTDPSQEEVETNIQTEPMETDVIQTENMGQEAMERLMTMEEEIKNTQQKLLEIEREQRYLNYLENENKREQEKFASSTSSGPLSNFAHKLQSEINQRPKNEIVVDDKIDQITEDDMARQLGDILEQDDKILEDVAEPDVSEVVISEDNDEQDIQEVPTVQNDQSVDQPVPLLDDKQLEFESELSPQEKEQVSENTLPLQEDDTTPIDNGDSIVLPGQPIIAEDAMQQQISQDDQNTNNDEDEEAKLNRRDDEMQDIVQNIQIEQNYEEEIDQDYDTLNYIESIINDDFIYENFQQDVLEEMDTTDINNTQTDIEETKQTETVDSVMEDAPKNYVNRKQYNEDVRNSIVEERQQKARDIVCRPMADDSEVAYRIEISQTVSPLKPKSLESIRRGVQLKPVGDGGMVQIKNEIRDSIKRYEDYKKQTMETREIYRKREIEEERVRKEQLDKWSAVVRLNRDIIEQEEQNKIEYEKRKKMFTRENANKKLIFPSVCDPDSFNVIEYLQDENGDFLMDPETGGPIMSSISSVNRNDAKKLSEQNQIAKGMLFKKPFYPYFGKACKNFFSNHEFSMLSRFLDKNGKVHKEVILQSDISCKQEAIRLYQKLKNSLRLGPFPNDYDMRKLLLELRTLDDAYSTYTTIAEYPYSNSAKFDEQEQDMKDNVESAIKSFERVTMAQLLKRLAESKQELEKESQLHQHMYNVGIEQASANVESAYPQYGNEGARGVQNQQQNEEDEDFIINPLGNRGHTDEDVEYIDAVPFYGGFGGGEWV